MYKLLFYMEKEQFSWKLNRGIGFPIFLVNQISGNHQNYKNSCNFYIIKFVTTP